MVTRVATSQKLVMVPAGPMLYNTNAKPSFRLCVPTPAYLHPLLSLFEVLYCPQYCIWVRITMLHRHTCCCCNLQEGLTPLVTLQAQRRLLVSEGELILPVL